MKNGISPAKYNKIYYDGQTLYSHQGKNKATRFKIVLDLLKKEIKGKSKLRLLDIGSRDGYLLEKAKELGFEAEGLDISKKWAEFCKKRGFKVVVANLEKKMPFKDSYFDAVTILYVIEHVADSEFVIKEVIRVLKKDGILVIATPNLASLGSRLRSLFGRYPLQMAPAFNWQFGDHVRLFTIPVLKKILERNNSKVEVIVGNKIFFNPNNWDKGFGSTILARIFPSLAQKIIIKARKL